MAAIGPSFRKAVLIGAWLVCSAVVASGAVTGRSLANAGIAPSVSSGATISNVAAKGDRLISAHVKVGGKHESLPMLSRSGKLPVGCDAAFSKLIKSQSQAVRCVTAIEASVKSA